MINKIILFAVILVPALAFSQDVIIRENGDTVDCKITNEDSVNVYFTLKDKRPHVKTHLNKNQIRSYQIAPELESTNSKSFMFELNFNPFHEDGVFSFDYLQTKFWINNKTAFRLGLQIDMNKNSISDDDYPEHSIYNSTAVEKSFMYGIKPGIEFRILENSKISPYWGIELSFKNKTSNAEYIEYEYDSWEGIYELTETKITGAWMEIESGVYNSGNGSYYSYTNTYYDNERAFYSLGGNLLFGTDFFFVKNFYFGFELGLGYEMIKRKQIEIESGITSETVIIPSSKTAKFGFYYNSAIRLGVWF